MGDRGCEWPRINCAGNCGAETDALFKRAGDFHALVSGFGRIASLGQRVADLVMVENFAIDDAADFSEICLDSSGLKFDASRQSRRFLWVPYSRGRERGGSSLSFAANHCQLEANRKLCRNPGASRDASRVPLLFAGILMPGANRLASSLLELPLLPAESSWTSSLFYRLLLPAWSQRSSIGNAIYGWFVGA